MAKINIMEEEDTKKNTVKQSDVKKSKTSDNTTVKSDNLDKKKDVKTAKSKQIKKTDFKLKEELKQSKEKIKEFQDKYLRLSAEFDNYRKRTLKEKMDLTKYASEDVLKDLLPVIDDFERAFNNIDNAKDCNAVKEGIGLINNKFKEFLSQKGLKEIEAINQDFNMDLHEAVTKIPAPEEKLKGKIVDVIEKGYMLNDKVIRYSKVVIGE